MGKLKLCFNVYGVSERAMLALSLCPATVARLYAFRDGLPIGVYSQGGQTSATSGAVVFL